MRDIESGSFYENNEVAAELSSDLSVLKDEIGAEPKNMDDIIKTMESLTADFLFLFDEVHDFVIASQEYVKYGDKLSYPKVMRGLVYGIASLQTRYLAGESLGAKQFKQMVHTNIESTLSRIEKGVYATVGKSIVTNIIDTYLGNKENCKMFISLFGE